MAYPTGVHSLTLEDIDRRILNLKTYATSHRNAMAAGNVLAGRILGIYENLRQERANLAQVRATAAATPGFVQFVKDQKNNQTLDVVVEFDALLAQLDGVTSWIETNFPKQAGNGYLEAQTFSGGAIVERSFTPAQTAGMRTQLDGLIAAIA